MLRTQPQGNFYSRASCEARRDEKSTFMQIMMISTHAPHARRGGLLAILPYKLLFLLTRLMRGAAVLLMMVFSVTKISTHAPHARRGGIIATVIPDRTISTHAPHARRGQTTELSRLSLKLFLLTRLMRGAALTLIYGALLQQFLLTRLMRGAAQNRAKCLYGCIYFYSRASCEARR